jgi:hypothetical protein
MIKIKRKESRDGNPYNMTYKPKYVTKQDINSGLQKMFTEQKGEQQERRTQPFSFKQEPKKPKLSFEPEPEPEVEEEEKPYWSATEWEQWAYQIYKKYPQTKEFLPDWFLEAVE